MTILTKPSIVFQKPDAIKSPLVPEDPENCTCPDEEKIEVYPPTPQWKPAKHSSGALMCMTIVAMLVFSTGSFCGLVLYRQYLRSNVPRHYQAYCSVPIDSQEARDEVENQLIEQNYERVLPLRWTTDPDVQVFSTADVRATDDMVKDLHEQFDIHGRVERVRVFGNGRAISFIHDFDDNVTGIVDTDRCFVMDLDPYLVLTPDLLVQGMERGDGFDISRVHTTLRAMMPALNELARQARNLAERCFEKPTYRLERDDNIIRKRSADNSPSHDYIQFSGKHVQEIKIANLADVLEYEQKQKK